MEDLSPNPRPAMPPSGGAHERWIVADPRARIVLVSFSLLFFELLCIRWIPAYVRFLSFFTNFILLASFLGMGLGILAARRPRLWLPPFPVLLLLLTVATALNKFDLRVYSTTVLYYGVGDAAGVPLRSYLVVPLLFGLVAAAFVPLARPLGLLLAQVKPLSAYAFDILGSLAGTAAFFLIALFSLPPVVWFAALAVPLLLLAQRRLIPVLGTALAVGASIAVVIALQTAQPAYWSPYYKIQLHAAEPSPSWLGLSDYGYILDVNNAGHQSMIPWQEKEPFYHRAYEIRPGERFRNALILGAGSGSDVAIALANEVKSVTAVEIDPVIQALGARFHPDRPYDNAGVRVVIDDGRAALRRGEEKYDLIIFALTDSLTLTSGLTSLRLESFLLTQDAIVAARARLSERGALVLYNYYREPWLVSKLATMVGDVFGQDPLVSTYGGWGRAAVIMAGPAVATLKPGAFGPYRETTFQGRGLRVIGEGYYPRGAISPATDDWPFLYLRQRTFPLLYVAGLAMVCVITLAGFLGLAPRGTLRRFDLHMFFLGVAFALLEVKSLITFALLFGSTWLVNSLVFFAILSSVMLAVLVNRRFRIKRIGIFYVLLFGLLALNLTLKPETLLLGSDVLRYVVASALSFAPVFVANLIFSNSFRDTEAADIGFASNLLGIMVGGMLEYFSMLVGYRLLLVPVMAFYALALVLHSRRASAPAQAWAVAG